MLKRRYQDLVGQIQVPNCEKTLKLQLSWPNIISLWHDEVAQFFQFHRTLMMKLNALSSFLAFLQQKCFYKQISSSHF